MPPSASRCPPAPRRRFWTPARTAIVSLALALPAASLQLFVGACAAASDGAESAAGGGSDVTTPVGSTGVGGVDSDATVPDGQPDVTQPTFAELCGEGECTPGEDDDCEMSGFVPQGCQIAADEDGEPVPECGDAGEGEIDAPCQTGRDCVPGDACVPTEGGDNDNYSGVCRPYCCGDVESCPSEPADGGPSFCAPRPLIGEDLEVPVCVPVAPCELLAEGACPDGTTCGVVRTDGTTSCVEPGPGTLCEACPCAEGLVCAQHANVCQKLCHIGNQEECGSGVCQGGSSEYPAGIGVCVSGENACE